MQVNLKIQISVMLTSMIIQMHLITPMTPGDAANYESDSDNEESPTPSRVFSDATKPYQQPKYIIFHNQLLMLLSICLVCFSRKVTVHLKLCGSMVDQCIKCMCCNFVREWRSQPEIRGAHLLEMICWLGLLFSGGLQGQLLRALQSINIDGISPRTLFTHQSNYLNNVVNNVWFSQHNTLLNELQGTGLVVGADGRCDSMGHSAKYGSYTAMDLDRNKVLTVELVQSNEVKSSTHMELKGLQKWCTSLISSILQSQPLLQFDTVKLKSELEKTGTLSIIALTAGTLLRALKRALLKRSPTKCWEAG